MNRGAGGGGGCNTIEESGGRIFMVTEYESALRISWSYFLGILTRI